VVTRDCSFNASGIVSATSLETALTVARGDALRRRADEVVVIGGTEIFQQTMALADRLEITHVHCVPAGDTFFPTIEAALWREVARSDHRAGLQDDADFSFVTYRRLT
jgi:dihydrofolate reductase